jgi:hypothetical protein
MAEKDIVEICDTVLKQAKISENGHKELIGRCLNILAKVGKDERSQGQMVNSKTILITALLYYGSEDAELAK